MLEDLTESSQMLTGDQSCSQSNIFENEFEQSKLVYPQSFMHSKELNSEDMAEVTNLKGGNVLLTQEDSDNTWYSLWNISFKKTEEEDCHRKLSI